MNNFWSYKSGQWEEKAFQAEEIAYVFKDVTSRMDPMCQKNGVQYSTWQGGGMM